MNTNESLKQIEMPDWSKYEKEKNKKDTSKTQEPQPLPNVKKHINP